MSLGIIIFLIILVSSISAFVVYHKQKQEEELQKLVKEEEAVHKIEPIVEKVIFEQEEKIAEAQPTKQDVVESTVPVQKPKKKYYKKPSANKKKTIK